MTNERLSAEQLFAQVTELETELDVIERNIDVLAANWTNAYARHDREAIDEASARLDFELANARRVSNKIAKKLSLAVKRDAEENPFDEESIGTLGTWRNDA